MHVAPRVAGLVSAATVYARTRRRCDVAGTSRARRPGSARARRSSSMISRTFAATRKAMWRAFAMRRSVAGDRGDHHSPSAGPARESGPARCARRRRRDWKRSSMYWRAASPASGRSGCSHVASVTLARNFPQRSLIVVDATSVGAWASRAGAEFGGAGGQFLSATRTQARRSDRCVSASSDAHGARRCRPLSRAACRLMRRATPVGRDPATAG